MAKIRALSVREIVATCLATVLALVGVLMTAPPASAAEPQPTTLTVIPHEPWWAGGSLTADVVLATADGTRVHGSLAALVDGKRTRVGFGALDDTMLALANPATVQSWSAGPHEVRVMFPGSADYLPSEWVGTVTAVAPTVPVTMKADLPDRGPLNSPFDVPVTLTAQDGRPIRGAVFATAYAEGDLWGGSLRVSELVDGRCSVTIDFGGWPTATAIVTVQFVPEGGLKPAVVTKRILVGEPLAPTPTIAGRAQVGATLTAQPGTWSAGVALSYEWKANGSVIAGATAGTFTPRAAQAGKRITVTVTGSSPVYWTRSRTSAATAVIEGANSQVSYQAHVQNIGWQPWVTGGQIAGTTGRRLRAEALRFQLNNPAYSGGITATAHVQNIGWMTPVTTGGGLVGTTGRRLRVEAFTMKLTGEMAKHYDIYYRAHAQNFGWLGWAKNGAQSGTARYAYRLEAVDVRLVAKGDPAPSGTGLRAFYQR